jgi:hypothetical protein
MQWIWTILISAFSLVWQQVLNVLVRIVKPAKPVPEEVARQLTKRSHSQKSNGEP